MGTVEKRTVSIEFSARTLDEAERRNVPVEHVAREALHRAVRDAVRDRRTPEEREALQKAWLEENAEALAQMRRYYETHEPLLAEWQAWDPFDEGAGTKE